MRRFLGIVAALALAALALAAPARAEAPALSQKCLMNRDIRAKRLSADQGYFAKTSRGWWQNSGGACPAYAPRRALKTASISNQQCSGDVVEVYDAITRIGFGGCALGDWRRISGEPPVPAQ